MSQDSFQNPIQELPIETSPPRTHNHEQAIHTIHIPESIRQAGLATNELILEAIAFLHCDGIVVLENAIDTAHLDTLNAILSAEALEIATDPFHHFNFGKETQNMDQAPPPTRELMFKDVWCNPFAAAILSGMLGPRPVLHYANGNTALRATGRQPVHSDCEFEHPMFPFAMVININLVDTSLENGATEVWVGSHHVSTVDEHEPGLLHIKKEIVEERRKHSPPIQACTKKGSLVIRDLSLWHAGMPNKTDEPRVMLAFVVQPAWFQGRSKVKLPLDVKDMVESWELEFNAEWVGEVDHKKISSADVDFGSKSEVLEKYREKLAHSPGYYVSSY
jgi:ectoine hydroxylase-related dioxygenase (phytanoyl-CoA dioxygenase family)